MKSAAIIISFWYSLLFYCGALAAEPLACSQLLETRVKSNLNVFPADPRPQAELIKFILENEHEIKDWTQKLKDTTPDRIHIPLRAEPGDPTTKRWGPIFVALHRRDPINGWKIFSQDLQELWEEGRAVLKARFTLSSFEEKIQIIDQWVSLHEHDSYYPAALPRLRSEDPYDHTLFKFIDRLRQANPENWWAYFSPKTQEIWREHKTIRAEPSTVRRTENESLEALAHYVRKIHSDGNLNTVPAQDSADLEVRRLGQFFKSFRRKYPDTWAQKLPLDIIDIWKASGYLTDDLQFQSTARMGHRKSSLSEEEVNFKTVKKEKVLTVERNPLLDLQQKAEYENWVRQQHSKNPTQYLIGYLPKNDPIASKWARIIKKLAQQDPENWWKNFDEDVRAIWLKTDSFRCFKFLLSDRKARIQAVDEWVQENKDSSHFAIPSQFSPKPYDRLIYRTIATIRAEYREFDWWTEFSLNTQAVWKQKNALQKSLRNKTPKRHGKKGNTDPFLPPKNY